MERRWLSIAADIIIGAAVLAIIYGVLQLYTADVDVMSNVNPQRPATLAAAAETQVVEYREETAVQAVRGVEREVWRLERLTFEPPTTTTTTETPVPKPKPESSVSKGHSEGVEQWRPLVTAYFGEHTDAALRVMACESGGLATAYNPSGAAGLMQMMPGWYKGTWSTVIGPFDPFDPEQNVAAAAQLFYANGSNWRDWVCKP